MGRGRVRILSHRTDIPDRVRTVMLEEELGGLGGLAERPADFAPMGRASISLYIHVVIPIVRRGHTRISIPSPLSNSI
jgi:hypothetical protein